MNNTGRHVLRERSGFVCLVCACVGSLVSILLFISLVFVRVCVLSASDPLVCFVFFVCKCPFVFVLWIA